MMPSLFSMLLSLAGGVFDTPFESKNGEVWFYHPVDGTFKYNACQVKGEWFLEQQQMTLRYLGVVCEDSKQWTFSQQIHNFVFERRVDPEDPSVDALFWNSKIAGRIFSAKRGFVVDFEDEWGDRHHVRVLKPVENAKEKLPRLDWFVSSSDYVSFDVQVW
jgi:hypothetical protein